MDDEKFDQHLMDYLFDELDEVTSAAMKRKIESDADCRDLALGLRATMEIANMPVEEPSADLEERILAAASLAEQGEPWSRKILRSISWAGSHAMRPQLAMAAMLVLVVGSSLLLLRVRTGAVAVTPTKEESTGVAAGPSRAELPAPAMETSDQPMAPKPASSAEATAVAPKPRPVQSGAPLDEDQLAVIDEQFDQAMASYNSGAHLEAQRSFAKIKATKSPRAASAALFEARAVRAHSGCKAAVPYYNTVRSMGGAVSADATWEQADCHRILGEAAQARALYLALKDSKSYSARAAKELKGQAETANTAGDGASTRKDDEEPPPPEQTQQQQEQKPAPPEQTQK